MPSFQSPASRARATMSAISEASKGALKQAKTRLRSASITSSGVVCGARRTILTPGRASADLVEDGRVLLEVRVGRGHEDVEGLPAQPADRRRVAGGDLDGVALEERRGPQGLQQGFVRGDHQHACHR